MAIRNDNLGGTDWSDGEKLYATDLNDTFDATVEKVDNIVTDLILGLYAEVYTVSFSEWEGDSSWLNKYLVSGATYTVVSAYSDTLTHLHNLTAYQEGHRTGTPSANVMKYNTPTANTTVTPLRVNIGMKKIRITTGSIPKNSLFMSELDITYFALASGWFTLDSSTKYVYLTDTISAIGDTDGSASHNHAATYSGVQVYNPSTGSGCMRNTVSGTTVNNQYNNTSLLMYKSNAEYDSAKDLLPIGTYLLFVGTSGDIPSNWEYVTDKDDGLVKWSNSDYGTQSGNTTHTHTIPTNNYTDQDKDPEEVPFTNGALTVTPSGEHMPEYKKYGLIKKISMT